MSTFYTDDERQSLRRVGGGSDGAGPDTQNPDRKRNRRNDRRRNSRHRRRLPNAQAEPGNQHPNGDGNATANAAITKSGENPSHSPAQKMPAKGKQGGAERRRPRHWGEAYAALDLGTNNCRLLVAVPQQPGRFKVIDAFSRIVRLGEGLAATGELREEAMDRAIGALKMCAGKLKNRRVKGVRLIATEACRRARNGEEFLRRVEQQTGIKLEIIDRETEARLALAGSSALIEPGAQHTLVFDMQCSCVRRVMRSTS